tara:strand:+ start:1338 stop:1601 length:264 start_codon:yes stop_codon:yes gene_type:complete
MVKRKEFVCPCKCPGQSCIVERRKVGDFVHVDMLMTEAKVPKLKHCLSKPTKTQQKVLDKIKDKNFQSITFRWTIDSELEKVDDKSK